MDDFQQINLPDGRVLAYAEYGDGGGHPLFFFHGGNDSRLEGAILDRTARRLGVRVIAPDRPGYGRSTFQPGRAFLDWPADVAALADALSLARFRVAGHSGGGPHALAVAYAMPARLDGVSLISSAGPPGSSNAGMHPMFRVANFLMGNSGRLHARLTQQTADQVLHEPDKFLSQWGRASKADGRLFREQPDVAALVVAEMSEALRQGTAAILQEHPLYKRPWGFDLAAIDLPVQLWHGLADVQAAPGWSEALAAALPQSQPHFVPDEGHFSILANQQAAILETL